MCSLAVFEVWSVLDHPGCIILYQRVTYHLGLDGGFLWKKREGGHIWQTRVWVQGIARSGFEGGRVAFDDCTTYFWNNLGWGTLIVKRLKSQIIKFSWASKLKGLNSYKDLLPFFGRGVWDAMSAPLSESVPAYFFISF